MMQTCNDWIIWLIIALLVINFLILWNTGTTKTILVRLLIESELVHFLKGLGKTRPKWDDEQ